MISCIISIVMFVYQTPSDTKFSKTTPAGWWFGTCFFSMRNNHPNWLIFFRGVGIPPTRTDHVHSGVGFTMIPPFWCQHVPTEKHMSCGGVQPPICDGYWNPRFWQLEGPPCESEPTNLCPITNNSCIVCPPKTREILQRSWLVRGLKYNV